MLSMIDREIQTIERLQAITDKFGDISNLFLTLITCGTRAALRLLLPCLPPSVPPAPPERPLRSVMR